MSSFSESWLAERMEGVPAEFQPWLDEKEEGGGRSVDGTEDPTGQEIGSVGRDLEGRGLRALRRARGAPGRNRDSAFHLLAADAHLTWSAVARLESSDPESELRALLRRVTAEGR